MQTEVARVIGQGNAHRRAAALSRRTGQRYQPVQIDTRLWAVVLIGAERPDFTRRKFNESDFAECAGKRTPRKIKGKA